MQLHALPLQPPGADGAKAETTGQELQPDGGEQGGRLEGAAETICVAGLAAFFLHAGDQHHNLMERLQPQLDIKKTSQKWSGRWNRRRARRLFLLRFLAPLLQTM